MAKKPPAPVAPKKSSADSTLLRLEQLAELMERHALDELEVEDKVLRVRMHRGGANTGHAHAHHAPPQAPRPVASTPSPEDTSLVTVTSPFVGTFYRAPKPGAPAFVEVGQSVRRGQTLSIVEAMKLMTELEAELDGIVVEILARDAQPVEYGQPLFRVRP